MFDLYFIVETWSHWGVWSENCSVTCGTGQETRSRQCSGSPGVGECEGPETDVRLCDKEQCGKLNAFSKLFCTWFGWTKKSFLYF